MVENKGDRILAKQRELVILKKIVCPPPEACGDKLPAFARTGFGVLCPPEADIIMVGCRKPEYN